LIWIERVKYIKKGGGEQGAIFPFDFELKKVTIIHYIARKEDFDESEKNE
jgi:hypothetical protein